MGNFRISRFNLLMIISCAVLLLLSIFFVSSVEAFAEEGASYSEKKIYSSATVTDDFADDSIIVIMKKESSDINKPFALSFASNNQNKVIDLTRINGNANCKKYLNKKEYHQIFKIELAESSKENVLSEVRKYENLEGVLWAGPNYYHEPAGLPIATTGTRFSSLWGLSEEGCNAVEAWNLTTGSKNIRIGVIDSGIANHVDLNTNLVSGWDFYNNNAITNDDVSGHGTHVAGIIGATGNSTNGVIGVSPKVSLVPLQVSSVSGKWLFDDIVDAISWAIDNEIDIINYSGGGNEENEPWRVAISNFNGLFVCCAGNDGENNDITKYYPSDYSNGQEFSNRVISVGNINIYGNKYINSNYGVESVSIYAPGANILSTVPTVVDSSGYGSFFGTSQATPHVTGVAALLLSLDPTLTADELKTIIINSADFIEIDNPDYVSTSPGVQPEKLLVKKLNAYEAVKHISNTYSIYTTSELSNNRISIDDLDIQFNGVLEIPSMINNKTVTKISAGAFSQQGGITEVIIPSTVETIENSAFSNCYNLKNVTFKSHSNLNTIQAYAFEQCLSLESLTIPSTVTNVSTGVLSFGERLTVYTDLSADPTTWDNNWNYSDWISIERPVVWGCTLSTVKSYVVSLYKTSSSITKANAVNGISAPYRRGYTFGGWYNNSSFTGTAISAEDIATAPNNVRYYARWIADCEVTFDTNGGSEVSYNVTVKNGDTLNKPIVQPTQSGYVFKYWALSTNLNSEYSWNTPITSNITLMAVWQAVGSDHIFTFDLDGGEGDFNTQVAVANGDTVSAPTTPTKVGYTFLRWSIEGQTTSYYFSTPVTEDITLVAVWQAIQTYTVEFDVNGGYGDFYDIIVNRNDSIEEPNKEPVKAGNYFMYWALSTNLNEEYNWGAAVGQNITLVAVWDSFNYTLYFNANGGSFGLSYLTVNEGDTAAEFINNSNVATPERADYVFLYWALSTNLNVAYNLDTPITSNTTLVAIWQIVNNNAYLEITNMGKSSGKWRIKIKNVSNTTITVEYNELMCFLDDAENWTDLDDVNNDYDLDPGESITVTISENWFATSIAVSYVTNGTRKITYADNLKSSGAISIYYNTKSE